MRLITLVSILFFLSKFGFTQDLSILPLEDKNKGDFYVYWGWNRGWFSDSDIHFRGNDYDFNFEYT